MYEKILQRFVQNTTSNGEFTIYRYVVRSKNSLPAVKGKGKEGGENDYT